MKTLIATVLAISTLLVAAIPAAAAFDPLDPGDMEWLTRSSSWRHDNRPITKPMTDVKWTTTKLFNATDTYILYLRAVEGTVPACWSGAGFARHLDEVRTYFLALFDANWAARKGQMRKADRLVGVAADSFAVANASRARIQSECA